MTSQVGGVAERASSQAGRLAVYFILEKDGGLQQDATDGVVESRLNRFL